MKYLALGWEPYDGIARYLQGKLEEYNEMEASEQRKLRKQALKYVIIEYTLFRRPARGGLLPVREVP